MSKKQFMFKAPAEYVRRINALEHVISDAYAVEKVGKVKTTTFVIHCGVEAGVHGQIKPPEKFRADDREYTLVKLELTAKDMERLEKLASGLGEIAGLDGPVSKTLALKVAIECAENWMLDHADQAIRYGKEFGEDQEYQYGLLIQSAILFVTQHDDAPVGPAQYISTMLAMSMQGTD